MKKTIIAGAASAVLAAMPVMGAFATIGDNFTDTIQVTINESCTLTRASSNPHVEGDNEVGTWGASDTLSGTLNPGAIDTDFGSSNFNVVCNRKGGWKVTAVAEALTGLTTDTESIPLGTPEAGTAAWNYTSSYAGTDSKITGTGAYTGTSATVAQSSVTTGADGLNFKVQYGVSVDTSLTAQTYSGTIKYTLAAL